MKKLLLIAVLMPHLIALGQDRAIYEPVPVRVTPSETGSPPSDAIILFDGSNLDAWNRTADDGPARWHIADGAITVDRDVGTIKTKQAFGNTQLHIEWRPTDVIRSSGQGRGNSGVFLHSLFELQILDSWDNDTYINGQAAAIYLQQPPLVNVTKPPGEWQVFDIVFTAPVWEKGNLKSPAYLTVLHNGVLVQNNVELQGATFTPQPEYKARCGPYSQEERIQDCTGKMPITLQDHGQVVSYRNIWVREL
jgi:hypothetical protein